MTYAFFALTYAVDLSLLLAVPTLIPCAMFMLIASDTSSTSIILNGLSIGFTLELDQQLPFAFLSAHQLEEIDNFLTKILKGREYRRTRWTDSNFKQQVSHLYAPPARVLATLSSFFYGYVVFRDNLIAIPCEQLLYFCYYRLGILMSLWVGTLYRESFELAAMLTSPREVRASLLKECSAQPWRWMSSAVRGAAIRFCETMAMAICLNFLIGMCSCSYWATSSDDLTYCLANHIPDWVADVFGTCAASGYAELYGLDCLPM